MASPLLLIGCAIVLFFWGRSRRKSHSLPPGPPGDPFLGHMRMIPGEGFQDVLYEWGKIYGDVMYLHILGRPIIVLNSVEAAVDLLDKKGAIYSDRPRFVTAELMGWTRSLTTLKYGKTFQKHRRMFQQFLNKTIIDKYQPIQTREARVLLQKLISKDPNFHKHMQWFSTAIIIRIAFGHHMVNEDDPYVSITRDVSFAISNVGPPGNTPVDFLPILGQFPSWFPGAFYGAFARHQKPAIRTMHDYPFNHVKKDMAEGKAKHCFISHELEGLDRDGGGDEEDIVDIQGAAATLYAGGAETTSSTLCFFVLAMVLYPDVQAKAQKEIEAVISTGRLPDFADRDSLPYVECVLQETLRWHGTLPLGLPHRVTEDDVYKGMYIPKGSIVIANARGMTLDERIYSNPHSFYPSRYLPKPEGNGEPHPNGPFGFGRRICPGRHFGDASLWIAIATMLATLNISKAIGDDGKEITPEEFCTSGVTSQPKPFRCRIQPRNDQANALIVNADTSDNY